MDTVDNGSSKQVPIGPERLSVRILRDIFAKYLKDAGALQPALTEYLKMVMEHPGSKRMDKTYARKTYVDLCFKAGLPADLPTWAVEKPAKSRREPTSPDPEPHIELDPRVGAPGQIWADGRSSATVVLKECTAMKGDFDHWSVEPNGHGITTISLPTTGDGVWYFVGYGSGKGTNKEVPKTPTVEEQALAFLDAEPEPVASPVVDDIDLDSIIENVTPLPPHPLKAIMESFLPEFAASSEHPFLRIVNYPLISDEVLRTSKDPWDHLRNAAVPVHKRSSRYVIVGTVMGTVASGKNAGKRINIHCTVDGFRRLRDVPGDIVVCHEERQLSVMSESNGLRRFLFCIKHEPNRKIRFWLRVNDVDQPGGARYIVLHPDEAGYRRVDRSKF